MEMPRFNSFGPAKFAVALALAVALAACVGPANRPAANANSAPMAKTSPGKAHLYVYLGRVHGQAFNYPNWRQSDFYINGIEVGSIGAGDYLYVELEPGAYNFSWAGRDWGTGPVRSAENVDLLAPDQDVFFALNVDRGAGALLGPIGWWADPDRGRIVDTYPRGRDKVSERRIVRADSKVLAQIRPVVSSTTYLSAKW
jgi:hypothetical protein